MKTIKTSIKKLGIFTIGQQNDSDVLDVVFDITEWKELYPYLTSYGVLVTSPDGIVYPANTEVIENVLVWHVSGADTAVVGEGEYQIVAVSESGNKKHTTPQKFSIIANMPGIEDAGDMPEYIEPWYEGVVQAASEAKESAQKAEAAAERAENTGISTEKIEEAVGDYLGKNPPAPGPEGPQGPKGETGPQGPQGDKGADGKTPVKGTDYFTPDDKTDMVNQTKAALPKLTLTGIDENGNTHTWTVFGEAK